MNGLVNHQFSRHAISRISVRGFTDEQILYALQFGKKFHKTGITFFFVGKRQIPKRFSKHFEGFEGITVLVSGDVVITAYKNKSAASFIKRKNKRASLA